MALSFATYSFYLFVILIWIISLYRDGMIGVGFRFLYGIHYAMFFLVGPVLVDMFELKDDFRLFYDLDYTFQILLMGLTAFIIMAYWIAPMLFGRRKIVSTVSSNSIRLETQKKIAWLLCILGSIAVILVNQTQQISTLGAIIGQSSNLLDTGVIMLCLHATITRQYKNVILVVPFVLVRGVISAAMSGHSGQLFIHALAAVCILAFGRTFTMLRLFVVFIASLVILIPASIWLDGRGRLRETLEKNDVGLIERIEIFVSIFTDVSEINTESLVQQFRNRGDYSELMAQAVDFTPRVKSYEYGATFLEIFPAVVPRFLWPEKPVKAGGNEFITIYTGRAFSENTSVEVGHVFEFYINFGVVGVIAGMAFMGFVMAYMEWIYQKYAANSLYTEYTLIFLNLGIIFYYDRSWLLFMGVLPGFFLCYILKYSIMHFYPLPYFVNDKK